MDQEEEARIINKVKAGGLDAYRLLVDAYKGPVFNLAYRMTGNRADADDVAQETFVRAFRSLKRFDASRPFFPWLYAIGLNAARTHLRKKGAERRAFDGDDQPAPSRGSPEGRLMDKQRDRQVQDALSALEPKQREAVTAHCIQGFSFRETAGILGISESAAKMRVYRGLEALKQRLSRVLGDDEDHG